MSTHMSLGAQMSAHMSAHASLGAHMGDCIRPHQSICLTPSVSSLQETYSLLVGLWPGAHRAG